MYSGGCKLGRLPFDNFHAEGFYGACHIDYRCMQPQLPREDPVGAALEPGPYNVYTTCDNMDKYNTVVVGAV